MNELRNNKIHQVTDYANLKMVCYCMEFFFTVIIPQQAKWLVDVEKLSVKICYQMIKYMCKDYNNFSQEFSRSTFWVCVCHWHIRWLDSVKVKKISFKSDCIHFQQIHFPQIQIANQTKNFYEYTNSVSHC